MRTFAALSRPVVPALLVCAGVAVALVFVEVGLRLASPDGFALQVQWGMPDNAIEERAGQGVTANGVAFRYDESGFRRGSGLPYDRSVLFVGDSFTEVFGVCAGA
jgi:hypothetical protein